MTRLMTGGHLRKFFGRAKHEPLVHFLAIGFALFVLYGLANSGGPNANDQILVNKEKLVAFIQSRQPVLDDATHRQMDEMTPAEIKAVVDEYVREETMYREASNLGLTDGDYLIRRRLARSLDFLFRNMEGIKDPSEHALKSYYAHNAARYAAPPTITFTQIYFDSDIHGWDGAERLARKTLTAIQSQGEKAVFASGWPGDRFAYFLNYAERDKRMVASHFGARMADALFSAKAVPDHWQGPFRSTSGVHLVQIDQLVPAEQLPYPEVASQVRRDLIEARKDDQAEAAYKRLHDQYHIVISDNVQKLMMDRAR